MTNKEARDKLIDHRARLDMIIKMTYGKEAEVSEIFDIAIQALEQTEWIPVSERLPEDKQSVLVWCPQYKNIYCAYLEKKQWWIFGAFVQIVPNEVVAWMPLPKQFEPQERRE